MAGVNRISGALRALARFVAPTTRTHADGLRSHPKVPTEHNESGPSATVEVDPPAPGALTVSYAPERDGAPDAGEIVWTWVPYAENDGRGKDRPVLVIAPHGDERVFAVRLTSKSHDGDHDFLEIGAGPWDSRGRPSWVDIDQVYSVHVDGMRREASALDPARFARVAEALKQRYGWTVAV